MRWLLIGAAWVGAAVGLTYRVRRERRGGKEAVHAVWKSEVSLFSIIALTVVGLTIITLLLLAGLQQ